MFKKRIWLLGLTLLVLQCGGPNIKEFQHLLEPRIDNLEDQKMLVVEAKGAPTEASGKGIGLLFKAYFKLKVKKGHPPAPRAWWPIDLDTPQEQWVGYFGLPVPDEVTDLPDLEVPEGLKVRIEEWEYGQVAEILHVGPYDQETPTIEKLKHFIQESGYGIAGLHEEEYVKGPGMFLAGDPDKYLTIIRYQVAKKDTTAAEETP